MVFVCSGYFSLHPHILIPFSQVVDLSIHSGRNPKLTLAAVGDLTRAAIHLRVLASRAPREEGACSL